VAAFALVAASCSQVVEEADLFYPSGRVLPMPAETVIRTNVELPIPGGEGGHLRGWLFTPKESRGGLLYLYGNGQRAHRVAGRLHWLAETFALEVLCIDYRGYGFSDGSPTRETLLSDAVAVHDFLAERRADGGPLFLYGRSLGSIPAIHVSAAREVDGLILEGAPSSAAEVIRTWDSYASWALRWLIRVRPSRELVELRPQPVDRIRDVTAPLLSIHGELDQRVPVRFGRKLFDAAGSSRKSWCLVEGAGHNNLEIRSGPALECLREFLER
jgi:hypothetical protein